LHYKNEKLFSFSRGGNTTDLGLIAALVAQITT